MRRNRKNSAKKERIIMLASSAFVLTALTMTGIYMQARDEESKDNGYTLDFTALENNTENKSQEIAQNNQPNPIGNTVPLENFADVTEDDLDYMPMEAGSGNIEIPGLTTISGQEDLLAEEEPQAPAETDDSGNGAKEEKKEDSGSKSELKKVTVSKELHFAESDGLLRPVSGEVLIPFSMDSSVYFSTLDQYKYNPALMLDAEEGTSVAACAEGKVIDIFQNAEIGNAVTMDLGDGYQITYGQLQEINVSLDSYVNPGEQVGTIAAPTKYYSIEGANLYLKLTMDGTPVNPELLFR